MAMKPDTLSAKKDHRILCVVLNQVKIKNLRATNQNGKSVYHWKAISSCPFLGFKVQNDRFVSSGHGATECVYIKKNKNSKISSSSSWLDYFYL